MPRLKREIINTLAPTGVLRAGINMANFLLVSGQQPDGTPTGLSPDLAQRIADELGVRCAFVLFEGPGQLANAVHQNMWDIGNIAVEPARAKTIDFTLPYAQIDANFMTRDDADFTGNDAIDTAGVRIAAYNRSAYDLWLSENLSAAEIVRSESIEASHEMFFNGQTDVLASLKPKLLQELSARDGYRIIEPPFTAIRQAVGIVKGKKAAVGFLNNLISDLITTGFVSRSMQHHGVTGKLSLPADTR